MEPINYKDAFPDLEEKIILNVDDNEMNQLVISKIMEKAGMRTIAASNGAEAIKKLYDGLRPDIILMDLDMPVLNGLQTSECIKRKIDLNIPIVINSGAVSEMQKWKLKRLGITEFLEKPYSLQDIFEKFSRQLNVLPA